MKARKFWRNHNITGNKYLSGIIPLTRANADIFNRELTKKNFEFIEH